MGKNNSAKTDALFSEAERRHACVVPSNPRERESLRRQLEQGKAFRPARGMYARASYWTAIPKPQKTLHILHTLQSLHPDWTFCHESAALAWGLPVSFESMDTIHVAVSKSNRKASSSVARRHIVEDDEPATIQGLRVTSLARTTFDCMRTEDFRQALAIADAALRLSKSRPSTFVSAFRRMNNGHTGVNHAIRTMYYADARSESGGESIARATMIERGFALPQLQAALPRPLERSRTYRVDFLWTRLDGSKVIGEFDGMQKYEDETLRNGRSALRVLADEQHRESQLTLYGMPIMRFSYRDVMQVGPFSNLLTRYGIPQSNEIARAERRLTRSRSAEACIFTVESLDA